MCVRGGGGGGWVCVWGGGCEFLQRTQNLKKWGGGWGGINFWTNYLNLKKKIFFWRGWVGWQEGGIGVSSKQKKIRPKKK